MRLVSALPCVLAVSFAFTPALTANGEVPGLTIDPERRFIDLDAVVVGNDVEWLELVACSPQSREHESLVTVATPPSQIHLALLTLGLEPGRPLHREDGNGDPDAPLFGPTGPEVSLSFVLGDDTEVPAHDWIIVRPPHDAPEGVPAVTLDNSTWLFTGSYFHAWGGTTVYVADLNGTVASVVSFGDDLLARPTTLTDADDGQQFAPNPDRMPADGEVVRLRIRITGVDMPPPEADTRE